MIETIDHNICTGCKMCKDVCPFDAIVYSNDNRGFWFPKVDEDKCKKCKICINKCPALNEELHLEDRLTRPRVFALWSKDEAIRKDSTSGAVFWEFGKKIIENGGYVIGSIYSNDWKSAHHFVGKNIYDLSSLKGSKYFQSDTEGIYKALKECVDSGNQTMFVGSPCQIAAVKSYLGKDYNNLILMDFICRGINSPLPFKKFIECLEEKYDSKVSYVQLKNKRTGWESLGTLVQMENGMEYHQDKWHNDIWVKGFLNKNLYMRNSCHQCNYRNIPHESDVTIGDFWGISGETQTDMFNGISSMMLNTTKGLEFYKTISDTFVAKEKYLSDLLPGNPALVSNPPKASKREKDEFFKLMDEKGFEFAIESLKQKGPSLLTKVKSRIKSVLRLVKRIAGIFKNYNAYQFIKLNFLSKNIIREKGIYIYPKKNCVISIDKTAKIYLKEKSLNIGVNKTKGSKMETIVKLEKNSIWNCNNGADLYIGTNFELKSNAKFTSGFFSVNSGSSIICAKEMEFGNDVMMGRNIIVYDSDFHEMLDEHGFITNLPQKVTIKDHVWLVNNIVVLKGVTIGENSLISSYLTVKKDVPANSVVSNGTKMSVHKFRGNWSRDTVK